MPPVQVKEGFTEEVIFEPGLKELVALCQVGMRRVEQRPQSTFRDRVSFSMARGSGGDVQVRGAGRGQVTKVIGGTLRGLS